MKHHVVIDPHTITPQQIRRIESIPLLKKYVDHVYEWEFEPIQFIHAALLLAKDPARYGFNLSHYLAFVTNHFASLPLNCISLGQGPSDFKRTGSESLGVGLAALFMNSAFGVEWNTMCHIDGKGVRPDFIGYEGNAESIFEAKGTTRAGDLEKYITKSKRQLEAHQLKFPGQRNKVGVCSYLHSQFPGQMSTSYVFDPPGSMELPSKSTCILRHMYYVYTFIQALRPASLIRAVSREAERESVSKNLYRDDLVLRRGSREVSEAVTGESLERHTGTRFNLLGRTIKTNGWTLVVGAHEGILREPLGLSNFQIESSIENNGEYVESVFSDGTVLRLSKPRKD